MQVASSGMEGEEGSFSTFLRQHWEVRKRRLPSELARELRHRLSVFGASFDASFPTPWRSPGPEEGAAGGDGLQLLQQLVPPSDEEKPLRLAMDAATDRDGADVQERV